MQNCSYDKCINWIDRQNFPVDGEKSDSESRQIISFNLRAESEFNFVSSPRNSDNMSRHSSESSESTSSAKSTASTREAKWMKILKQEKLYIIAMMEMKDPPTKKTVFKYLHDFQKLQATLFDYDIVRRRFVMSPEEQLRQVTMKQWKDSIDGIYNSLMMEVLVRPMPSVKKVEDFRIGVDHLKEAILADIESESNGRIGISHILNAGGSTS